MHTIFLDADRYPTARALHEALQMMLSLPDHYGCNADALHDCLSGRTEPVSAVLLSPGQGETARAVNICCRVLENLGGHVIRK